MKKSPAYDRRLGELCRELVKRFGPPVVDDGGHPAQDVHDAVIDAGILYVMLLEQAAHRTRELAAFKEDLKSVGVAAHRAIQLSYERQAREVGDALEVMLIDHDVLKRVHGRLGEPYRAS